MSDHCQICGRKYPSLATRLGVSVAYVEAIHKNAHVLHAVRDLRSDVKALIQDLSPEFHARVEGINKNLNIIDQLS
jgi:hypothetical protein